MFGFHDLTHRLCWLTAYGKHQNHAHNLWLKFERFHVGIVAGWLPDWSHLQLCGAADAEAWPESVQRNVCNLF